MSYLRFMQAREKLFDLMNSVDKNQRSMQEINDLAEELGKTFAECLIFLFHICTNYDWKKTIRKTRKLFSEVGEKALNDCTLTSMLSPDKLKKE